MASTNGELVGSALQGAPKEILFNDPEYDKEFRALQEYIPFVNSLMKKTGGPQAISRLQSLHDLLSNDKSRMNKETLLKCKTVLKKIHMRIEESKTLHSTDSDNTQEKKNEVPPVPDSNSPPEEKSDDRSMMKTLKLAAARTARNSGVVGAESPSSSLVSVPTDAKQESPSSSLERSRDKLKMLLPFSIPDQEEDAARSPRNFESIRLHPDSPRNDWDFQDTGTTTPKSPICWNPYPPENDGDNSSNKWKVIDEYNVGEDGKKMLSTANNQNTKLVPNVSPVGSSQSNKSLAEQTCETPHVIPESVPNHPLTVKHVLDAASVSKTVQTAADIHTVSVMTSAPTTVSKPVSTSKLVPTLVSEALPSPVCQQVPPPAPQPVPPPAPQPVPPPMELNWVAQDHDSEESTARSTEAKSAQPSLRAKLSQEINKVHRVGTSTGGSLRGLASKDPKIKIPIISKEAGSILDKDKIKVIKKPEKIIEIDMFSKEHTSSGKKVQEKNVSPKLLKGLYAPRFVSVSAQALLTSPKPVANKNKTSTERILKSPVYAPSEAEVKNPSRFADNVTAVQFGVDTEAKNEKSGTGILANMTQEEIKRAVDLNLRDLPSPPTISAEILDSGKMTTLPSQSTANSKEVHAVTRPAFSMSDVNQYNQKLSTQSQIKKGPANLHELPFLNAAVGCRTAPTIPVTSQGAQNKVEVNISPFSSIPRAIVDNCFPSSLDTDLRALPQKHSILRCDPRVERAPLLQSPFPVFDHNTPSSPYDDSWKVSNEDSTPRTPRHITYNLDQSYQHHGQQHQEDPRRPWGNNTPRAAEQFDLHHDRSTFPATSSHEMYGPRDITPASCEETRQNSGLWHEDTHWQNFTDHNNPDIVQEPLIHNRYHDATIRPWMPQHHARTSSLDPNAVPRLHQPFVSPPHQRQIGTSVDHMRGPQHHQPYIPPGNKRQVGPSCNQPVNNLHTGNQQPLDRHGSMNRGNFDHPKTNFEQPANRYSWSRTEFGHEAPPTRPEFGREAPPTRTEFGREAPPTRPEFGREAPPTRPEFNPDATSVNSRNIGPELKPISRVEAVPRCPPENSYRSRNERLSTDTQHRNDSNGRRRSVEQKDKSSRNTYQSAYKEKQRAFESRRKSFEKERASRQESDKKDSADAKQIKKDEIISPLNSLYGSTIIPRTGQGYGFQNFKIPKIKRDPPVVAKPVSHDLPVAEKPRPLTPPLVKPALPIQTILSTPPPIAEVADIVPLLSPTVVSKESSAEVNNTEDCRELPQASTSKDVTTEDESVEALISKALGMNKAKMIFDLLCTKLGKLDGKKLKEFLFEPSSDEHDSEDEKVKKAIVSEDKKSDVKVSLEPLSDSNVIDLGEKSIAPEEERKTLDGEQELANVKEITVDQDTLQLSRRLRDRNKNKTVTDIPNVSIETSDTKGRKNSRKIKSKLANVEDEETKEPDQSKPAKLPKAKRRNYLEMLQADILNMFISEGVLHATGRRLSTPFKEDINRAYNQLSKKEQKQQDASTDEGDSSTLMGARTKSRNKRRKADKKSDVSSDKRKGILQKKQIKKVTAENTCSSESNLSDVPAHENFDSDDSDVEVKINKERNKMASDKENKEVVTTKQKPNARRSRKSQASVTDLDKSFDELLHGKKGNVNMNKSLDSQDTDKVISKPKRVPNFDSAEDSDESSSLQTIPIRSTSRGPPAVVYSSESSDDGDRRSKRRNSPACYLEDFSESGEDEGKKSKSKKTVKSIGNVKGLDGYNEKKEERVQKKKKTAKKTMRPKSRVKIYSSDSEGDGNSNSDEDSPKEAITKPHSVHQSKHLPRTEYCTKPPFLVPLLTKLPGEKIGLKEFDPSSSSDSTFEQIPLSKIPGPFSRSVARRGGKSFNRSRVSTKSPDIQEQCQADLDSIGPDQTVKILFRAGRKTSNSNGSFRKSIQDVIERLTKDVNSSKTSDILKEGDTPGAAVILKRKTENSRKLFFNKLETSVNTSDKESHLQNDKTFSVSSRKNINKKRKRNNWSQGVIKKNKRLKSITERGRTRTPDLIDDAQLVSPQKSADDPETSKTGDHDGSLTWTEGEERLKSTCSELLNPEEEDAAPHIEEKLPSTEAGALDSLETMQLVDLVTDGVLQLQTATCDESVKGRSATEESNGNAVTVEEHVEHKLKADAELLHLEEPISEQSMGTNDDKTVKVDTNAVEKFELLAHGIMNVDKEYAFCEDPSKRYQCKLCTFNGVTIVAHYLLQHPSEEPYISRLPVTKAETAIAESKQNLYSSQTVAAKACGKRIKKSDPDFICRICFFKTKNTATFYEHCCTHTGEFRYSCDECQQKMANLACFRSHVHYYHRQLRAVKSLTYTVLFEKPSFNTGTVFAYLCSSCNFVQMLKSNVEKHIKFHHSAETSPEIVRINMHAQTSKTRKKLRRPRKSADTSGPEEPTVQDPSTELMPVAEPPSTDMGQEGSSDMPQQDVNLTVFVPTDVRDEEKEKSILEQRKNMLEEITKNLTNRGFLNNEKRSSLFDVLSKRTEDAGELSPTDDTNFPQSYDEENLSIGADEASFLVAQLEQNSLMDDPLGNANIDDNTNFSIEVNHENAIQPNEEPVCQNTAGASSMTDDDPGMPTFSAKKASNVMDNLIERLKQSTSTVLSPCEQLPVIKQEKLDGDPNSTVVKVEPDDVGTISVGPFEAKPMKTFQLFSCLVSDCVYTSMSPKRFVLHVVTHHPHDTWNGLCQTCNLMCNASTAIPSQGGQFSLVLAVLHLLKSHLLLETETDAIQDDQHQDEAHPCDAETLEGGQNNGGPVFRIRMRRLSGDKLSLAKDLQEDGGVPIDEAVSMNDEAMDEQDMMPCVIENVVSLAEEANADLTEAPLFPFTLSSSEPDPSTVVPLHFPPQTRVQTAYFGIEKPPGNAFSSESTITVVASPVQEAAPIGVQANPIFQTHPVLQKISLAALKKHKSVLPTPKPDPLVALPLGSATVLIPDATTQASSKTKQPKKQAIKNLSKVILKSGSRTARPQRLFKKNGTFITENESKDEACYAAMMNPRKLRHLFKCVEEKCFFTSNCSEKFRLHLGLHKKQIRQQRFGCTYCYKDKLTTREELVTHMQTKHGHCLYQCAYCFYRAVVPSYVVQHQNTLHVNESISILLCVQPPGIPAASEPSLHPSEIVAPYRCHQGNCNAMYHLTSEFASHLISEHSQLHIYSCHVCEAQVFNPGRLISHYKNYHSFAFYQCTYCVHGADTEEGMHRHLSKLHPHLQPKVAMRENDVDVPTCARTDVTTPLRIVDLEVNNKIDEVFIVKPTLADLEEDDAVDKTLPTEPAGFVVCEDEEDGDIEGGLVIDEGPDVEGETSVPVGIESLVCESVISVQPSVESSEGTVDVIDLVDLSEDEACASQVGDSNSSARLELSHPSSSCFQAADSGAAAGLRRLTRSSPQKNTPGSVGKWTVTNNDPAPTPTQRARPVIALPTPVPGSAAGASFEFGAITTEELALTGKTGAALNRCGYAKCGYSCADQSELRDHLMVCDNSRDSHTLLCPHCERSVRNVSGLIEHLKLHGTARYGCGLCQFRGTTARFVSGHLKSRHRVQHTKCIPLNPYKMDIEKDLFVVGPLREKVSRWGRKTPNSPAKTKPKFVYQPNEGHLLPMGAIYPFKVTCATCSFTTKVRINMERHLAFHDSGVTVPSQTPVNAVPCLEKNEMMFDKMTNLAASSNMYKPPDAASLVLTAADIARLPKYVPEQERYVCGATRCNYSSCDESMLLHHLRALHRDEDYVCPHCALPAAEQEQAIPMERLSFHLKMHDNRLYKCGYCFYFDHRRYIVDRHLADKHRDRKPIVHAVREPSGNNSTLVASDEAEAVEKEPTPTKEVPTKVSWQCGLCEFECSTRSEMVLHTSNAHNIKSQFKCNLCAYRSSTAQGFDVHFSAKHPGEEPDFIRTYSRVDVASPETSAFDTSPLWSRDLPRVKHIRGILFDDGKDKPRVEKATPKATQPAASSTEVATVIVEEVSSANTFDCSLCTTFKTNNKVDMKLHLFKEMKYLRYICNHCHKKTCYRNHLVKHLHRAHPDKLAHQSFTVLPVDDQVEKWVENYLTTQQSLMKLDSSSREHKLRLAAQSASPLADDALVAEEDVDITTAPSDFVSEDDMISPTVVKSQKKQKKLPRILPCKHCGERFSTVRGLKLHIRFAHLRIGKWKCAACEMTHNAKVFVERHCQALHPLVTGDLCLSNPHADEPLVLDTAFWEREYGIGPSFAEQYSTSDPSSSSAATAPKRAKLSATPDETPDEVNKCRHCPYRAKSSSDRRRHHMRHWKQKPLKCGRCDFDGIREFEIKKHSLKIHPNKEVLVVQNKLPDVPVIQPIRTKRKPDTDYVCEIEDDGLEAKKPRTEPEEMIEFVIVEGLGEGEGIGDEVPDSDPAQLAQCFYCDFSGSTSKDVYEHWTSAHKEPVLLLNGSCKAGTGLVFKELASLQDEEMFTRAEGESRYSCGYCVYQGTRASVTEHQRRIHSRLPSLLKTLPADIYSCRLCNFKTSEVGSIRLHVTEQHGCRREADGYRCVYCTQQAATFEAMLQHHNSCHPSMEFHVGSQQTAGSGEDLVDVHNCPACSYFTPDLRYMKEHLRRHARPYQCGYCLLTADFPGKVRQHSASAHPGRQHNIVHLETNEDKYNKMKDRVTVSQEKRGTFSGGGGVAKKSTTWRPRIGVRSKPVARKSTGNSPKSKKYLLVSPCIDLTGADDEEDDEDDEVEDLQPFSVYGEPREQVDLGKLTMQVTLGSALTVLRVTTYAGCFNINPVVLLEDCRK